MKKARIFGEWKVQVEVSLEDDRVVRGGKVFPQGCVRVPLPELRSAVDGVAVEDVTVTGVNVMIGLSVSEQTRVMLAVWEPDGGVRSRSQEAVPIEREWEGEDRVTRRVCSRLSTAGVKAGDRGNWMGAVVEKECAGKETVNGADPTGRTSNIVNEYMPVGRPAEGQLEAIIFADCPPPWTQGSAEGPNPSGAVMGPVIVDTYYAYSYVTVVN